MKTIEVPIDQLRDLLNKARNYDVICDAFKIAEEKRGESYIPDQIMERVRTYMSGYIGRRSLEEKENGAAFIDPTPLPLQDPNLDSQISG